MFVGVDGCRAGWLAIGLETEHDWKVNIFPDVSSLWDHHRQASLILIDIPIGLKAEGRAERRCDPEARKLLGPRRSSVFPAPCRGAIYASSYQEACDINQRLTGKRLSVENWNIIPKIREVDCLLSDDASAKRVASEKSILNSVFGVWRVVRCNTPKNGVRDYRNGRNFSSQFIRGLPILSPMRYPPIDAKMSQGMIFSMRWLPQ